MATNRGVWRFLLITFGWSWLFWVPAALVARGLALPPAVADFLGSPFNPAAWGPLLAAVLITLRNEGRPGVTRLLRRGLDFRFRPTWYLVIFLLFPALIGGSLLLAVLSGEPPPELAALAEPLTIPIAFLFILFLGGPLQEEFGWRGYLLPRLQERYSALLSAIAVGLVWGLWHLPLFFLPRQEFYYQRPIWGLLLSTVLVSVLFTWLYNNTRGSIFAALLFHTMFNLSHYLFPTLGSDRASLILFGLLFTAVAAVVVVWGPKRMAPASPSSETARPSVDPPVQVRVQE